MVGFNSRLNASKNCVVSVVIAPLVECNAAVVQHVEETEPYRRVDICQTQPFSICGGSSGGVRCRVLHSGQT